MAFSQQRMGAYEPAMEGLGEFARIEKCSTEISKNI
jgi:hypothetical protein